MPQCPVCKKPTRSSAGAHCNHCGADLGALWALAQLPTDLHNAGLQARRLGDEFEALTNLAAAARLTDDPRPLRELSNLLADLGLPDLAATSARRVASTGGAAVEGVPAARSSRRRGLLFVAALALLAAGMSIEAGRHRLLMGERSTPAISAVPTVVFDTVFVRDSATEKDIDAQRRPRGISSTTTGAADVPAAVTHKVRRGDTLWGIAEQYLGDGNDWRQLTATDGGDISDPRHLAVGTVVRIGEQRPVTATKEGR